MTPHLMAQTASDMTMALPSHGPIACRRCLPGTGAQWEFHNSDGSRWCLENSPAAFGATSPGVLVLGFSKGVNQSKAGLAFDDIAFAGMRKQLAAILQSLRLLARPIDECIRAGEQRLGFGSLIRCSVAQWDPQKEKYSKSGNAILQKFAKGDVTAQVAKNCVDQFLRELPARTKLVVLLGNEARYIEFCKGQVERARGEARAVNAVSYDSVGVRFVHVIHAKAQGALIPDWLAGRNSQQEKRRLAVEAVGAQLAAHPYLQEAV